MEKVKLRSHFRDLRKKLSASSKEFSSLSQALNFNLNALCQNLFSPNQVLLSFSAYGSEPPVEVGSPFRIGLPKVYADSKLKFFEFLKGQPLEKNQYGILEPIEDHKNEIAPTAAKGVLVPGIAFDRSGNRLGSGQGFYDRFLEPVPRLLKIGVCFSIQLSKEKLPSDPWDMPMDWLVTEREVIRFMRKG